MTNSYPHSPLSLPSVHLYYSMLPGKCQPLFAQKLFEKSFENPLTFRPACAILYS